MVSTSLHRLSLLLLFGLLGTGCALGQTIVEYGSTTSKAAGAAAGVGKVAPKPGAPSEPAATHMPAQTGGAKIEANLRTLRQRAGADAAKVSLRSTPDHAQVWIDGLFIGTTPLEVTLAPGSHQLEMRGAATELIRQKIELAAKQTREITLPLNSSYPSQVSVR